LKKYIKIAGNVIMVIALAFVVKKLLSMDISPSQFRSGKTIAVLITSFVIQTVIIIFSIIPWLMFTRSLSGVRIPFKAAMPVYTRSNIYKYLPGNVFQYVGRNQLAADMKISHVDVACATLMDIFFSVVWAGIFSVILLGSRIAGLLREYGRNMLIVAVLGVLILAAAAAVIFLKFRKKAAGYLSRYSKALEKGRRGQLIQGIAYYIVSYTVSAGMYFLCLTLIVPEASLSETVTLTGAYLFAWIVGFVTPGAPGGIGIREGVMIFVSGDRYQDRIILFVLIMRISSIAADVAAFAAGRIYQSISSKSSAA
jgi:hypothetical protein